MRREAERLNHLVENVLSYSRLERGSARAHHQKVSLGSLLERLEPRLVERARKDLAVLVAFLCSPRARYITGAVLTITGGMDLFTF